MEQLCSFSVVLTGDGSPSLRGDNEPMHHLGGAYAETQYIYGEALRGLKRWPELAEWKAIVVGLGLGYIELLAMAEACRNGKKLRLLSYEIKQELVDAFLAWLNGTRSEPVYERMYEYFQKDYPELDLKKSLWRAHQSGEWEIRGALNSESLPTVPYNAILFDAFSGKSTPDLWTEDFLKLFLKQAAHEPAIFATYACTGVLRRTLQGAGFAVEKKIGFLGKRNSTQAILGTPS